MALLCAVPFVLSCQQESLLTTPSAASSTRQVSARIDAGDVPSETWNATDSVHFHVVSTDNAVLLDTGISLLGKTGRVAVRSVVVRSDLGVTLVVDGSIAKVRIWSGTAQQGASADGQTLEVTASLAQVVGSLGTLPLPTYQYSSSVPSATWTSNPYYFDQPVHIYLTSPKAGATIHYTLDGTDPDLNSPRYGDTGILLDSTRTVKAIATMPGWLNSPNSSYTGRFTLQPAPVIIGADNNIGWPPFKIGLSCQTAGTVIHYTTDGSVPTAESPAYVDSLTFSGTDSVTYKAIAIDTLYPKIVATKICSTRFGMAAPWNSTVTYGSVKDDRDGRVYRTVSIGLQTWMAENLNYKPTSKSDSSLCYSKDTNNCLRYGRLYNWSTVMQGATSSTTTPSGVKGICPTGWFVPSYADWNRLLTKTIAFATAGKTLKYRGWEGDPYDGDDSKGFRVLLTDVGRVVHIGGSETRFWTASAGYDQANYRSFDASDAVDTTLATSYDDKTYFHFLRCVKNGL